MQRINLINYYMETKFTEQESLSLINEMIKQARNNFQKGSGNSMIFHGLLVSVIAILNVVLAFVFKKLNIDPNLTFWIWCLMIPAIYIGQLIDKKIERESIVKTHLDSIMSTTWNGFMISICLFLMVIFSIGFGRNFFYLFYLINPVILLLIGLAEFVSAKTYRFRPYLYGAVLMWIGTLVCTAMIWTSETVTYQLLILALCMFFGFVIPGYQLNKSAKENV